MNKRDELFDKYLSFLLLDEAIEDLKKELLKQFEPILKPIISILLKMIRKYHER